MRSNQKSGFSLVESLVVIAIMAILLGVVVNGGGASASSNLTSAGYQMQTALNMARENSIAKHHLTAIAILIDPTVPNVAYRTYTFLETSNSPTDPNNPWTQADKWEHLPAGVIIDNNNTTLTLGTSTITNTNSFVNNDATPSASPAMPTLIYNGHSYLPKTGYIVQILESSGGLSDSAPSPCILTLTTGFYSSGGNTPTYTYKGTGTSYSNYFCLFFNNETGQIKILRQ